jgi:hypothetical protein
VSDAGDKVCTDEIDVLGDVKTDADDDVSNDGV